MTQNLILGLVAMSVGLIAILATLLAPNSGHDARIRTRRGWFQAITYGIVPIIAGAFFLAAWWQETHPDAVEAARPMPQVTEH